MTALSEKIAAEHEVRTIRSTDSLDPGIECICGEGPMTWLDHAAHIAAVTEREVRQQVAAEIRALESTREQVRNGTRVGILVDFYTGHDYAVERAARIAEKGLTSD